jgi:hypothetical protein
MNLAVTCDTQTISTLWVKSVKITSSIHKESLHGELSLSDPAGGCAVLIHVGSAIGITVVADTGDSRSYAMRVTGYSKLPTASAGNVTSVVATLIDEWSYLQTNTTTAYKGSVSEVATSLLAQTDLAATKYSIESSSDIDVTRYCLHQAVHTFIKKIATYARNDVYPMYFYKTLDGVLHLKSTSSMAASPQYLLIPRGDYSKILTQANSTGRSIIRAYSLAFYSEQGDATGSRVYDFQTKHVQYTDSAISQLQDDSIVSDEIIKEGAGRYQVYPWWMDPPASFAAALRDSVEHDHKVLTCVALVEDAALSLEGLGVGNAITMTIPGDHVENGTYVIHNIDAVYETTQHYCKLYLVRH